MARVGADRARPLCSPRHHGPLDGDKHGLASFARPRVLEPQLRDAPGRDRRPDDAEQELRKALDLQSSLVSRFPEIVPHKVWMGKIQNALAELLMDQGQMRKPALC